LRKKEKPVYDLTGGKIETEYALFLEGQKGGEGKKDAEHRGEEG